MKNIFSMLLVTISIFAFSALAQADIAQIKIYKEAYPEAKPKCISCHTSALPKKDADHELNDYGKKVKSLAEKPTAEEYKKAGPVEDSQK